jgi:hypothetical protein
VFFAPLNLRTETEDSMLDNSFAEVLKLIHSENVGFRCSINPINPVSFLCLYKTLEYPDFLLLA